MSVMMRDIKMVDSRLLCEYIFERGGEMSHLKLQKLLYYVQALHLAYFESPIIEDDFEAWLHGPVCRKIYDQLKAKSILHTEMFYVQLDGEERPSDVLPKRLTKDQLDLVNEVIDEYSKLSSTQLESLTHNESPWLDARKGYAPGDRCEEIISKDSMKSYYKNAIYGSKD